MVSNTNIRYEAPQVEVVEIEIEKGFAASSGLNTDEYGNENGNWQSL